MSNSEADAAAARIFGGGRFRTAAIIAFLLPAVALGACDNLWRDGGSDPEKAGQEMQKKTSDLYKKCVELAIDADVQADEERGHRGPQTAQEITAEVMDPKRAARRILEKPTAPSDYETECVRPYLRGCLLPPERVKKVEEYVFRVNACPDPKGLS